MLRGTIQARRKCIVSPKNRRIFKFYAGLAIFESSLALIVGVSILSCAWKVSDATFEFDTLARIAYLYDLETCDVIQVHEPKFTELQLSTNTAGFNVVPIKRMRLSVPPNTRTSAGMRRHIKISIALHVMWAIVSILTLFAVRTDVINTNGLKMFTLNIFYLSYACVCFFDSVMAITYIAHLRESLTMGMVIRYSGWKDIQVDNYDKFAGWLSFAASLFWLRGGLFFVFNLYGASRISVALRSMTIKEFSQRLEASGNVPIPDAVQEYRSASSVLYVARNDSVS